MLIDRGADTFFVMAVFLCFWVGTQAFVKLRQGTLPSNTFKCHADQMVPGQRNDISIADRKSSFILISKWNNQGILFNILLGNIQSAADCDSCQGRKQNQQSRGQLFFPQFFAEKHGGPQKYSNENAIRAKENGSVGNLFQSDAAAGCHLDSGSQNDADNAWFKALENSLKVFVFQSCF